MNRRGFLGAILAAAAAPAIVRASSLMPVAAPKVWTPPALEIGRYEGFRFIEDELTHYDHLADAMRYGIGMASIQVVKDAQGNHTRLTRIRLDEAFKKLESDLFHVEPYRFRNQ